MFFWDNIGQDEVVAFLHQVLRHLHGHVIALLDNNNTHRGAPLGDLCRTLPRLRREFFPSCAFDLNPDEAVWGLLKGKLANGQPDDLRDLEEQLQGELRLLEASQ
jgi:transposase